MNNTPLLPSNTDGEKRVNGQSHPDAVRGQQVYECTCCGEQAWMLFPEPEGEIRCGSCQQLNTLMHYLPKLRPVDAAKRELKLRHSRVLGQQTLCCTRCSYNGFHLHASGTITCYRCRHSVIARHWNPAEMEVPE